MQWHWGNIGSALAGASTVIIALAALKQGPAAVRAWIDVKRAEADAAREQAKTIRLDRQRGLGGWSAHGVNTYTVALVTGQDELDQAAHEVAAGGGTSYVVLRVDEGGINRAHDLRETVKSEGAISRPPTIGEKEALRKGLDVMEIQHPGY